MGVDSSRSTLQEGKWRYQRRILQLALVRECHGFRVVAPDIGGVPYPYPRPARKERKIEALIICNTNLLVLLRHAQH